MGLCFSQPAHDISNPGADWDRTRYQQYPQLQQQAPPPPQYVEEIKEPAQRRRVEQFVITYDVGTTGSGAAYVLRDATGRTTLGPAIVDRWPGAPAEGFGKVPSVIVYDRRTGRCRDEWGFLAVNSPQLERMRHDIQRVEWFKLHIQPEAVEAGYLESPDRQLPDGKTAMDVYADYLTHLHRATLEDIRHKHGDGFLRRLSDINAISFVITCPVSWLKNQSIFAALRRAAVRAGVIYTENADNIDFVTEPEASAMFCYDCQQGMSLNPGDIFTVCDAGGGTVDLTTFRVEATQPYLQMSEVDVGIERCLFHGATFIEWTFDALFKGWLRDPRSGFGGETAFNESRQRRARQWFREKVMQTVKCDPPPSGFYDFDMGVESDFNQGWLDVPWQLIDDAFSHHINPIVEAVMAQVNLQGTQSKVVFLCGGLGSSHYLRQRLESNLGQSVPVLTPGGNAGGSRAVAMGGALYGLNKAVVTRKSPACFGIEVFVKSPVSEPIEDRYVGGDIGWDQGGRVIKGIFSPILHMGQEVDEDQMFSKGYIVSKDVSDPAAYMLNIRLLRYSTSPDVPRLTKQPGVEVFCKLQAQLDPQVIRPTLINGMACIHESISVDIYLGKAEVRAQVKHRGQVCGTVTTSL